ncbi:hypothetical protein M3P19_01335 [Muricauda sp. 2012CJ35-5]|uniref:Leucine-rich repeat domain-containing protein n=1 Tax=Flagellimonas spongiicola TaxID=2942208 RepID=A0ABT0PMM5_9FLAO|nr:hypothetical protein [Allomuricauda spongiicola]MCL6272627.1 hypothetical protein [Allomuricauda spongiicola]
MHKLKAFLILCLSIWHLGNTQTLEALQNEIAQLPIYTNLDKASQSPTTVYRIHVPCEMEQARQWYKSLALFENVRELKLCAENWHETNVKLKELNSIEFLDLGNYSTQNTYPTDLPAGTYSLNSLVSINLNGLPNLNWNLVLSRLSKLTGLRNLALMNNGFVILPKEIEQLHFLEALWLGSNSKLDITDSLKKLGSLRSLRHLGFGGNGIRKIPKEIKGLQKIELLWLSGNPIESLETLSSINSLEQMALNSCDLKGFPETLFKLNNLNALSMRNNPNLKLDWHVMSLPNKLKTLDLRGSLNENIPLDYIQKTHLTKLVLDKDPWPNYQIEKLKQLNKNLTIIIRN